MPVHALCAHMPSTCLRVLFLCLRVCFVLYLVIMYNCGQFPMLNCGQFANPVDIRSSKG